MGVRGRKTRTGAPLPQALCRQLGGGWHCFGMLAGPKSMAGPHTGLPEVLAAA